MATAIAKGADILTPAANPMPWTAWPAPDGRSTQRGNSLRAGHDRSRTAIQAEIARNLYRLWFSYPSVMGVTWWNVVDGGVRRENPHFRDFMTKKLHPKPVYLAIDKLINQEWKTRLTLKADAGKPVAFRGFKGRYRVSYTDASGAAQSAEFHLAKDGDGL